MSTLMESLFQNIKIYRNKNYIFQIPDRLKCVLCSSIILDARQTSCGCRYCKQCIDSHLNKQNKKCINIDCEEIEMVIPDRAINKEIGKLKVKCIYDGCIHEDLLKDIGDHLVNCQYQTVVCDKCNEDCVKLKLDDHLKNDCKMRQVQCPNCGDLMDFSTYHGVHHNIDKDQLCSKYEGPCPYKCGVKGNVNVRNHRKECPKKPFPCPFSDIGCAEIVMKKSIKFHLSKDGTKHAEYSVREFKKIREEHTALKNQMRNSQREIDSMKSEIAKLKRGIENINSGPKYSSTTSNIRKSHHDNAINKDGVYIWKIVNFSRLKENAERGEQISTTSDSFYTKEFGYKMCMKIYPSGDGVGKGTHFSVFFTLMKGEFDDILSWPFKNKVIITLLDQKNKTDDHSCSFKPDPKSTCYQKPTDEYNMASGSPKFIIFSDLFSKYIEQDRVFLKIQVLN